MYSEKTAEVLRVVGVGVVNILRGRGTRRVCGERTGTLFFHLIVAHLVVAPRTLLSTPVSSSWRPQNISGRHSFRARNSSYADPESLIHCCEMHSDYDAVQQFSLMALF